MQDMQQEIPFSQEEGRSKGQSKGKNKRGRKRKRVLGGAVLSAALFF